MSVDIIFSLEEDGPAISTYLDLGSGGYNGNDPDPISVWIRHNGTQPIVNPRLYIQPLSGTYYGVHDAQEDYDAVLRQSSLGEDDEFGLLYIDITGNGDDYQLVDTENAADISTAITLPTIGVGESIEILLKFDFDSEIDTDVELGLRQIDLRLTYTYTT